MLEYIDNDVVSSHILVNLEPSDLWSFMNVNKQYQKLTKEYINRSTLQRLNTVFNSIFTDKPDTIEKGFKPTFRRHTNIIEEDEEDAASIDSLKKKVDDSSEKNIETNTISKTSVESGAQFKEYLKNNNATISGGLLLRCILNTDWMTDIDMYLPSTAPKKQLLSYSIVKYDENKFNKQCDYITDNKSEDIHISYIYDDTYGYNNDGCKLFRTNKIESLQRIGLKAESSRECDRDFDFDICKNTYWYDGKDNLKISNYYAVLNHKATIVTSHNRSINKRLIKYIDRGFSFAQSKLFLNFLDYLQQYTVEKMPYTDNSWIGDHKVKYTLTGNLLDVTGYYTQITNSCNVCRHSSKSKCQKKCQEKKEQPIHNTRHFIDDVKCNHYYNWHENRTICTDCLSEITNEKVTSNGVQYTKNLNKFSFGNVCSVYSNVIEGCSYVAYLEADNISAKIIEKYNLK